jgi:hypothetical protein
MTKTLNQIICFFLHQNQNIFFNNIGNQNIFLEKNHNPPFKLNGPSLIRSVWFMVFNVTFNNISVISWRLILLVEVNGVPGENHRPVSSH